MIPVSRRPNFSQASTSAGASTRTSPSPAKPNRALAVYCSVADLQLDVRKALKPGKVDGSHQRWMQTNPVARDGVLALVYRRSNANTKYPIEPHVEAKLLPYTRGIMSCVALGGFVALGLYVDALEDLEARGSLGHAQKILNTFQEGVEALACATLFDTVKCEMGGPMLALMAASRERGTFPLDYFKSDDNAYFKKLLLPAICVFCAHPPKLGFERALQAYAAADLYSKTETPSGLESSCWNLYVNISHKAARTQDPLPRGGRLQGRVSPEANQGSREQNPLTSSIQGPLLGSAKSAEPEALQPPRSESISLRAQAKRRRILSPSPTAPELPPQMPSAAAALFAVRGPQAEISLTPAQIYHATRAAAEMTPAELGELETIEFFGADIVLSRGDLRVLMGLDL